MASVERRTAHAGGRRFAGRSRLHPVAWAAALVLLGPAGVAAQNTTALGQSPGNKPSLVYTPLSGMESPLHPRVPGDPQAVFGAVTTVARVLVEVDRNHVPADGQSAIRVTVRVLGKDSLCRKP
jgi:hypothetical protein